MKLNRTNPGLIVFIEWLIEALDQIDHATLVRLIKQAGLDYDEARVGSFLENSLETFMYNVPTDCDHEAGICNCDFRFALRGD